MKLSEENQILIEQIPPRDEDEAAVVHQRWMRLSGDSTHEPDYLPLVVKGIDRNCPDEMKKLWPGHIRFLTEEQFDDPEKMLYEQLFRLVPLWRFPGDGTAVVMPWFGNAFLVSAFGMEMKIVDDTVWPSRHLSRDEVKRLELPQDLAEAGLMPRVIQFIRYAKSVLPGHIPVGLFFMMSPYDLAYLIRGDKMMIDMYEAPEVVHHLMSLCTDLFIRATKLFKMEAGEPDDFYRYGPRTFAGGGHLCEDCCVMLSPELHSEFSIPYTRQALDALGGGWIHFCGDGRHIIDSYLNIPNLYGIEYGQLHLNGPVEQTVRKFIDHDKALNSPGKESHESWSDYFTRLVGLLDHRKYIWTGAWAFTDEKETGKTLLENWHEIQDRTLEYGLN